MQMVSSFISPLTGVNTSNMLVKLNFITGAVQEFVWSVSYPVLILNSWLFQPFQLKFCWQQAEKQAEQTGKPFWLAAAAWGLALAAGSGQLCSPSSWLQQKIQFVQAASFAQLSLKKTCWMKCVCERGSGRGRAVEIQGVRVALRQNLGS